MPYVRVRLLPPQPLRFQSAYVAPSSSGLGRRPLKAEVEGSNPFGATKKQQARAYVLAFPFGFLYLLQMLRSVNLHERFEEVDKSFLCPHRNPGEAPLTFGVLSWCRRAK